MRTKAPVSDYELVKKMLDRLVRLEGSRRTTPKEAEMIHTIRTRWTNDGQSFAMGQTQRNALVTVVDAIETRLKTPPYRPFY